MAISILLADDHDIFRQGLTLLLSSQPGFEVVGQAADGLEAVSLAERLQPDVVILDMLMPGLNGIEATLQIKQRLPDMRVIVLSLYDDERYSISVLKNGASGYVLKDSSAADLVQAVLAVMQGQCFLSPALTQRAVQAYISQAQASAANGYNKLTGRERQVMQLAVEGLSCPKIAERLYISERTVETHLANLMRKLELHSRAELIQYARQRQVQQP